MEGGMVTVHFCSPGNDHKDGLQWERTISHCKAYLYSHQRGIYSNCGLILRKNSRGLTVKASRGERILHESRVNPSCLHPLVDWDRTREGFRHFCGWCFKWKGGKEAQVTKSQIPSVEGTFIYPQETHKHATSPQSDKDRYCRLSPL